MYILRKLANGREYSLEAPSTLVGRTTDCDICIAKDHASREHARLRVVGQKLIVEDLHSTNGTFVNERQINTATTVVVGDVLKFGEESFAVQHEGVDATIMMRPIGSAVAGNSVVIQDENEGDATCLVSNYSLPAGWSLSEQSLDVGASGDVSKHDAIESYIHNYERSMRAKIGLAIVFLRKEKLPSIKYITTNTLNNSWTLGRSQDADISYDDPSVSGKHVKLVLNEEGWSIQDLSSKNGVWIDGNKVKEYSLKGLVPVKLGNLDVLIKSIRRK